MSFVRKIACFFTVFICFLSLFSCSEQSKKDTAYCFSIVFEKVDDIPNVTLYCKIHGDDESGKMNDISFALSSDTFTSALDSSSDKGHDIYFSSTQAIYFSDEVTLSEKEDIIIYFLNNTKYQSSVYILTSAEGIKYDASVLHNKALDVCKNEKINYSDKILYTNALTAIRENTEN